MSKREAPGGAKLSTYQQPAILAQGANLLLDASPTRIARMIQDLSVNEQSIKSWEDLLPRVTHQNKADGGYWAATLDHVKAELTTARRMRDEHIADLKHVIDYAINTAAYEDVPCSMCRLPADGLEFIQAFPEFQPPAIQCKGCLGLETRRAKRTDAKSIEDAKLIGYWGRVLDDAIRCAKIKANTSECNQAYIELEADNWSLLVKFGDEKQTSLEGDDALQGVRQGLVDAAMRFSPLKKKDEKKGKWFKVAADVQRSLAKAVKAKDQKGIDAWEGCAIKANKLAKMEQENLAYACATFNTVAFSWCRRNSRARHYGQKRAGVYAPSIETIFLGDRGGVDSPAPNGAEFITSAVGALGTLIPSSETPQSILLDLRDQVARLPEQQRSVVNLGMAGLTTGQISDRMSITRVAVRKLKSTAFESLRDALAGYANVSVLCD